MHFAREGYIFVYRDARRKWISREHVRPYISKKKDKKDVGESSDTPFIFHLQRARFMWLFSLPAARPLIESL